MKFSANLGFLWQELPFVDRILAASQAGFEAVECHFPYDTPAAETAAAMTEAGVQMVSLNAPVGSADGDFGIAAVAGREAEARDGISQALEYAAAAGCQHVSVIGGRTGGTAEAEAVYRENLSYAAEHAAVHGTGILLEPMSERAMPGAHLRHIASGIETIAAVGATNVRLMVDTFHTQITEGDLFTRITHNLDHVGHLQISAVPDRGEPNAGEVDYRWLLPALVDAGYDGWIGAEYRPRSTTDDGLGWMTDYTKETR